MKILADATLPGLEQAFPAPFELSTYDSMASLKIALPTQDILLCRSTLKINEALLNETKLSYLMTASSGRDHIDESALQKKAIQIFDAKGTNAMAVVDYVVSTIAYLNQTRKKPIESVGIIGLGEVGSRLKKKLLSLHHLVACYDPPRAAIDNTFPNASLRDIQQCDAICIHTELTKQGPYPSYHLMHKDFLKTLSENTIIINAARGDIVDEQALLKNYRGIYCTDVYTNEPNICEKIVAFSTLCTPHIAGHTIEAKIDAVRCLSLKLHQALHYQPPCFPLYPSITLERSNLHWIDKALEIYHPLHETVLMKKATDKKQAFLSLRPQHQRHGSEYYTEI